MSILFTRFQSHCGSDEPEIKMIRIVNSNTEKEEGFMFEMCSTILKSSSALARHKMSINGSDDDKYVCSDCGTTFKS